MNEKLILLEDISGLGKAGDKISVATGYARNYLLPRKLALTASKGAVRQFEALKEKIDAKRLAEIEKMQVLSKKLTDLEITISMNVGDDDKFYGSVTSHTIASEIKKLGVEVDHHKLVLENPIKELGSYDINVKLHPDVVAKIRVCIVRA